MRMMVTLAIALIVGSAANANAATIVLSTFDTDAQGWTLGEMFSTDGATAPTFVASGGNPGGFIRTADIFGFNAFQAPASYLGNQSAAYGGSLTLDTRSTGNDVINYPLVAISNGTTELHFRTPPPSTTAWTSYSISFLASAGWEVVNESSPYVGAPATEAQLQAVLANLQYLNINGDWNTGADQVDLDNVALNTGSASAIPEPASLLLLGTGLGLLARRRRKTDTGK